MNFNKKSLFLVENGKDFRVFFFVIFNFVKYSSRNTFTDEKRRFEARVNQLEEELEEEQTNAEINEDKLKKLAMTYEQALVDITNEKAHTEKLEVYSTKKTNFHNNLLRFFT
jgi:hypothetical protein